MKNKLLNALLVAAALSVNSIAGAQTSDDISANITYC